MMDQKQDVLHAAKSVGLFALARQRSAAGIRILCYHGVWLGDDGFAGDSMFMRAETFQRRLALIRREGYPVIRLSDAVAALRGHGPLLPPAAVAITIDDGWFSTYRDMLPALRAHGMPATLYCDTAQLTGRLPIAHVMARYVERVAAMRPQSARQGTGAGAAGEIAAARRAATDLTTPMSARLSAAWRLAAALDIDLGHYLSTRAFDYMTPDELRDAFRAGLDVQLHTHNHTLGDMGEATIASEIALNRGHLSELLDQPAEHFDQFCYPSGVAHHGAARCLGRHGIASATTTAQGIAYPGNDLHLLPRLLDGENLSDIEFEAELCGFGDWLRRGKHAAQRITAPLRRQPMAAA